MGTQSSLELTPKPEEKSNKGFISLIYSFAYIIYHFTQDWHYESTSEILASTLDGTFKSSHG